MKLYKRLLSLLLVCFVCFGLFSVNALAVEESENLVDGNLSNWTDYGDENQYFQSANVSYLGNNVNYIEIPSNNNTVLLFDLTKFLKIGDSYRFSFNLPTTNGYNSSSLTSCVLTWALCDGSGDIVPTVGNNVFEININETNKSNYLGKITTFEFTYTQGFQNTFLCLFVSHGDNVEVYEDLELYISDVSLNRVTSETENKLDGILGWLEDIKNSITGLGDKLTSVWENITSSISSLGDRFSGFITSLGDRISGFFENLITNVKTFFEELPSKIFGYEIEVTDDDIISDGEGSEGDEDDSGSSSINLFSDLQFETTGGLTVVDYGNYYYVEFPKKTTSGLGYKYQRSIGVSIESEVNYLFSFDVSSYNIYNDGCYILIESSYNSIEVPITGEGSYSVEFPSSPVPDTVYITLAIYSRPKAYYNLYDLSLTAINAPGDDTGSGDEGTTTKVSWFQYLINKFKSWFTNLSNSIEGFFIKLYEDIKGLFIPSEGYFDDLSNRFDLLIEERFGALVTITDYLVEFFSSFNADTTKEFFDVPIININLMGYNFPIGGWQVRFVPQFNGVEILINACKFIFSVLATFAFFDGLKNKYHEVFGGGE